MSPEQIKLLIQIAILAAIAAAGFGAGWTINGWRLSGKVEQLEGTVATQKQGLETFKGANDRCAAGVEDVQRTVKNYVDESNKRQAAAAASMARAEEDARGHLKAANSALNRPAPSLAGACDTLVKEAVDYAQRRKAAP